MCGKFDDNQTSPVYLLRHYGVEPALARRAYRKVRFYIYRNDDQFFNQMMHTEVHILYIAFFLAIAQSAIVRFVFNKTHNSAWLLLLALIIYVYIIIYDTDIHITEAAEFRLKKEEILVFLEKSEMIYRAESSIQA